MSVQIPLFVDDKTRAEQARLLEELIRLKAGEIEEREFRHFWGTPEACAAKRREADAKIRAFEERVRRAFPGVLEEG